MTVDAASVLDAVFTMPGRVSRVIIDLDAIANNVRLILARLGPDIRLMAVVKADGYGHGAVMVARSALEAGASLLGVATVGEAAMLRERGQSAPIVLLGPCDSSEIARALSLDVELAVGSGVQLQTISAIASGIGRVARVHLKIDTGMHRFGATLEEAVPLLEYLTTIGSVELVALMSHLSSADDPADPASDGQRRSVAEIQRQAAAIMERSVAIHVANSAATLAGDIASGEIARVGIAMYGLAPSDRIALPAGARPVLSLVSRLARVHVAPAGSGVSYGHTYLTSDSERLGLVPVGYADGYRRGLSNLAWACVREHRCPMRGRVCMDQLVIGDLPAEANVGDLVGLAGPYGEGPSVDSLAAMVGTINYEFVAGLSPRIPRYYILNGGVAAALIEGQLHHV